MNIRLGGILGFGWMLAFGLTPGIVHAQAVEEPRPGVTWVNDYQAGLKEALSLGKTHLILATSADCVWCTKMMRETFVEPGIQSRLKSQWVCTRLDAGNQRAMVDTLKIRSLPTLILANPRGTILARLEGYQNPQVLATQLDRVRYQWETEVATVTNQFREAIGRIRKADLAGANALLTKVVETPVEASMHQEAKTILDLVRRGDVDAILKNSDQTIQEILSRHGIESTREAPGTLTSRNVDRGGYAPGAVQPLDLLGLAKEDLSKKQVAAALEKLTWLAQQKPDSPETVQAVQLLKDLQTNTESLRFAVDQMQEKLAQSLLQLAENNLASGEPQQAMACFEQVIRIQPGSRNAELAQTRIAQLQGQPNRSPKR